MEKVKIKSFVEQLLRNSGDNDAVVSDESLILSGRLDSISIAELIIFFEDEYFINVSTSNSKFYTEIDTVDKMVDYVYKRKG